jgi:uncharacterized membrane protein YkvA (DUF1232 family)
MPSGKLIEALERYRDQAETMLETPAAVESVVESAQGRAEGFPSLKDEVATLSRLVTAHLAGTHTVHDSEDVAWAVAGLMYVASPWDLAPDYLPSGLQDDERACAWVVERIRGTLTVFDAWERPSGSRRAPRRA